MKFNNQVCTNIYQSERLLKLGLDKETADMSEDTKPAWSLSKLIDLMPEYIHFDDFADTKYYLTLRPYCLVKVSYKQDSGRWLYGSDSSNLFDAIIDVIEHLILEKHFDKQYLN